jgi:hypothetical protein
MAEVDVVPASPPGPTWWSHHCAEAWTAAWMTAREREFVGPREVLADPAWSDRITWQDSHGRRSASHRPDLLIHLPSGGIAAIEVELARKSTERLRAILGLHDRWRHTGATRGVIYICGDENGIDRIRGLAGQHGFLADGGLRTELLETTINAALSAAQASRAGHSPEGASMSSS